MKGFPIALFIFCVSFFFLKKDCTNLEPPFQGLLQLLSNLSDIIIDSIHTFGTCEFIDRFVTQSTHIVTGQIMGTRCYKERGIKPAFWIGAGCHWRETIRTAYFEVWHSPELSLSEKRKRKKYIKGVVLKLQENFLNNSYR